MADYFDALEVQDPKDREQHLQDALPGQIAHARDHSPAFARILADIDPEAIVSRADLARLPVTRKADLADSQRKDPPLGGFCATATGKLAHIFQTPGPIYAPEVRRAEYWRFTRALFAAGFRRGELIHNACSYHFSPEGFMVESCAWVLGCPVFPAGTEQPDLQIRAIADLKPKGYTGPAAFLLSLLERLQAGTVTIDKALVIGEPPSPELREALQARGVEVFQCYATPELGLIAYETAAHQGLVVDEGVLVEIVAPGSGEPLPEGETGEVVVTTFNPEYPLIRFATGDRAALLPGPSPCGRTNTRLRAAIERTERETDL